MIFLLFFLLPFQFSLGSVGGSDLAIIRLLIPLFVCAWLANGLYTKKIYLPRPLTLFFFMAFLFWTTLSLVWAENPEWAVNKIIFWWNFFPLFFVLISIFQNTEMQKRALQGLVYGGLVIGLVGITQFIAQFFLSLNTLASFLLNTLYFFLGENFANAVVEYPSIFVNIGGITFLRAFAFFPDPHIFAYYTAMLIPLAGHQALQSKSTVLEKCIPLVLLIATIVSFSRAAYVALLVASGIFIALVVQKYKKRISVPAVLLVITVFLLVTFSPIATRFISSFSAQDGSVTERSRLWQEALVNIKISPLTGVGLGNYPLTVKPSAEPREPIYVHNLYLDMAVEIGIIGLALFLLFILSCLPHPSFSASTPLSYRFALSLSLIIFLTHSFFEYPLFSVHILPLLLIILALLYVEKIR